MIPPHLQVKDKVITPKKKGTEKGSVDKKSSVFKIYEFDSSEDEPVASKTTEKKRVVGRIPNQTSGNDPIAAHFSNKIANKQSRTISIGKGLLCASSFFLNVVKTNTDHLLYYSRKCLSINLSKVPNNISNNYL